MALLSVVDEMARAWPGPAFSSGYEGDSWMNLWCEDCVHCDECPLILVAITGRTPRSWERREAGGVNRYTCTEYTDANQRTACG